MPYILADLNFKRLLPLTFTRPVSHLLLGMDRIVDKWEKQLGTTVGICTAAHLSKKFPCASADEAIVINASVIPGKALIALISNLPKGQMLAAQGEMIAMHCSAEQTAAIITAVAKMEHPRLNDMAESRSVYPDAVTFIKSPADIFTYNGDILKDDFNALSLGMRTIEFPKGVTTLGDDIYVEQGAILRPCTLNAETGPIYIARGAEVMEGCTVRGPLYLGEGSSLKMGAKIYGPTSIGKHCKVGGEVNNSIIHDYSNKGHDGFLGNSVVGSWCNLGADTNTSNLKNNYGPVRVWNYDSETQQDTGLQFHGLVMGDHSKAGINTMFNTGAVVGVCSNVYGSGFPQKFIPSFSWGSAEGFIDFDLDRAYEMARAMTARRGVPFTEVDMAIFKAIFELDAKWRK